MIIEFSQASPNVHLVKYNNEIVGSIIYLADEKKYYFDPDPSFYFDSDDLNRITLMLNQLKITRARTVRQIAVEENDLPEIPKGPAVEGLEIANVTKIASPCGGIAPQDGEPCALEAGHNDEHSHVGPFRNKREI